MKDAKNPYVGYRYPAEIISHTVSLQPELPRRGGATGRPRHRRDLRDGTPVVSEFGQAFANERRRRAPRRGDKWHLDEVYLTINGRRHYLWRAVDQDGYVLDILVQSRRNKRAAKRFFRKLLKDLRYAPRVIVTDKLKSYEAARKERIPGVEHRQHTGLNNRAELSHQPTRQRERQRRRFKSPGHTQRCLAAQGPINNLFRPRRHRMAAAEYRTARAQAFETWQPVTCAQRLA